MSHKEWELPNFVNLIGWNRYWQQSRFFYLYQYLDRLHFVVKKLQTKIQTLIIFFSNYLWSTNKSDEKKKKRKEDDQTFAYFSSAHRRLQEKCQLVKKKNSYILWISSSCLLKINILLTELSQFAWENLDLSCVCTD